MKTTPNDFQDVLAGRQNKPEAVEKIKETLAKAGLNVKVSRRKLADGTKIYFTVRPPESIGRAVTWLEQVRSVRQYSVDVIIPYFPKARVTSGGSSTWTIAEY